MAEHGITVVMRFGWGFETDCLPSGNHGNLLLIDQLVFFDYPIADSSDQDLAEIIPGALETIEACRLKGKRVLVICILMTGSLSRRSKQIIHNRTCILDETQTNVTVQCLESHIFGTFLI